MFCLELVFEGRDLYLDQAARRHAGKESIWSKGGDGDGVGGQRAGADSNFDDRIEWLDEEDDAPASMKCGEVRMLHLNTSAEGSRGSRAMVLAGRGARSPKRSASDRPRPLWLYNKPTPGNTWLGTYKGSTSLV